MCAFSPVSSYGLSWQYLCLQLQDIYNSNMGKYCKPGEKKGMQLPEFLQIMYDVEIPLRWT